MRSIDYNRSMKRKAAELRLRTASIHQPGSSSCIIILDFSESTASTGVPSENALYVAHKYWNGIKISRSQLLCKLDHALS